MDKQTKDLLKAILVGSASYILCFTVGRYIFTPILAWMQKDIHFNDTFAGILSSANFVGYLLGTVFIRVYFRLLKSDIAYFTSVVILLFFTASTGLFDSYYWWVLSRFATGFTGAVIFLISFSKVVSVISYYNMGHLAMYLYCGIGITIALYSKFTAFLTNMVSWKAGWLILGLTGIPFAIIALLRIDTPLNVSQGKYETIKVGNKIISYIIACYFCMGFANNISATFIVASLQKSSDNAAAWNSWVIVGVSAAIAPVIFSKIAKGFGYVKTILILNLLLTFGILLSSMYFSKTLIYLGSIFFGMTFLTIPPLILTFASILSGRQKDIVLARMTIYFSIALLSGPAIAGFISDLTGSFVIPTLLGAAIAFAGVCIFFYGSKKYRNEIIFQK
jgi:predicted MFS family arabinose efflux permease